MRINTTQTDKLTIRDTEVKTEKLGKEKLNKPLPCLSQFGEVPP
jgi:hypothetical protein